MAKLKSKGSAVNENIRDTLVDIAGYAAIGISMQDQAWNDSEHGIRGRDYRRNLFSDIAGIFEGKLADYGTKDLWEIKQITQRIIEKIMRIENLSTSHNGRILVKRDNHSHMGILQAQHAGDAGMDLVVSEDIVVTPMGSAPVSVPIGISLKLPDGYWAEIRPRSSTATKLGIFVFQSVMDNQYTGPWFVVCNALGNMPITVKKGTRLAQCILHKLNPCAITTVDVLPETTRGAQGFGSTGLEAKEETQKVNL